MGFCLQGPELVATSPAELRPVPTIASRASCPAKAGRNGPVGALTWQAWESDARRHVLEQVSQNISLDNSDKSWHPALFTMCPMYTHGLIEAS